MQFVRHRLSFNIFFAVFFFLATGCGNLRFLNEGEALFKANKIELRTNEKIRKKKQFENELKSLIQIQPNKKFLGLFKTRLWFYNVASRKKVNKFRYWMKNKVGEPPALYDSLLVDKSAVMIANYLKNKGYFYPEVSYEAIIKSKLKKENENISAGKLENKRRRKTAVVRWDIHTGSLYRIRSVKFPDDNRNHSKIIYRHRLESLLIRGNPFDVSVLKKERDRISDLLRNEGYYLFNREYVYFDIDSSAGGNLLDLSVKINLSDDTTRGGVYYIDQIYVFTDFSLDKLKSRLFRDTVHAGEFHFISGKLRYRPKILISAIHFSRDSLFRKVNHTNTVSHLSELGVFKYVNVEYTPRRMAEKNYLDCMVYLSPAKKQDVSVEFEANNNTDYNLGTSLTLSYRNKNIFRGTELLHFSVSGGFESNLERGEKFFNTIDLVSKLDLYFNQFLVPFMRSYSKNIRPRTRISVSNEFLRRIDYYTTNTSTLIFGYEWSKVIQRRHIFNPITVNLVRILESTPDFENIINSSPSLKNSFTQQLILGMEYTYIWSNRARYAGNSFFYYIGRINTSGNLLHLGKLIQHRNDGKKPPYTIFEVEFSQYFLIDSDLRNYLQLRRGMQLVSRWYGGIGIPYGNSRSLTYIKQFFSGGANSMRGWLIRSLGPGSFNFERSGIYDHSRKFFFDQTGEIKMEANLEYRFDVFKFFKGALFLDIGNIWLLRADTSRAGANFNIGRFWNEFAIATGLGLRFDFNYFVLRFDLGLKVREPADGRETWPIGKFQWKDIRPNIAIGYPF